MNSSIDSPTNLDVNQDYLPKTLPGAGAGALPGANLPWYTRPDSGIARRTPEAAVQQRTASPAKPRWYLRVLNNFPCLDILTLLALALCLAIFVWDEIKGRVDFLLACRDSQERLERRVNAVCTGAMLFVVCVLLWNILRGIYTGAFAQAVR